MTLLAAAPKQTDGRDTAQPGMHSCLLSGDIGIRAHRATAQVHNCPACEFIVHTVHLQAHGLFETQLAVSLLRQKADQSCAS